MMYLGILLLGGLLLAGRRRGASGSRRRPESTEAPPTDDYEAEDDVHNDLGYLHPAFEQVVRAIIADLQAAGWPVRVYETYRSSERQAQLRAAGRSKVEWSLHEAVDGDGAPAALAVDIIHASDGWSNAEFFADLATAAEAHGAVSGHRWKWRDSAHVQAVPVSAQRDIRAGADPMAYMATA